MLSNRETEDAAHRLWERYSSEMEQVAKRRMRRLKRRDILDKEDFVVSAFAGLCLAARNGQLAGIANRDGLWAMLIVNTNPHVWLARLRRENDQNARPALE